MPLTHSSLHVIPFPYTKNNKNKEKLKKTSQGSLTTTHKKLFTVNGSNLYKKKNNNKKKKVTKTTRNKMHSGASAVPSS